MATKKTKKIDYTEPTNYFSSEAMDILNGKTPKKKTTTAKKKSTGTKKKK